MRGHSGRYGVNGDTACGGGEGGGYRICDMSESVWVWIDCSEKCRVASKELRVRGKRAPASPEKKTKKKPCARPARGHRRGHGIKDESRRRTPLPATGSAQAPLLFIKP